LYQAFKIRAFHRNDFEGVIRLVSDIIVNEFNFKLEFNTLDSDILDIEENYNKSDGGSFWVAESVDDHNKQQKIVGTTAVRNLKKFEFTCELKRMYVLKEFRRLGLGQKLLDIAVGYAKSVGYSKMVLDSSRNLQAARALYLKKGFVDIPRYNDNYRADVFMEIKLVSLA
jgi:ribosomal protein S18 acetylase RimI-like enzyme